MTKKIDDIHRRCCAAAARLEQFGSARVDAVVSADLLLEAASLLRGYSQVALIEGLPCWHGCVERLLRDYHQQVEVENEARGEWFWLDEIEDRIGRDRYNQIMRDAPVGGER